MGYFFSQLCYGPKMKLLYMIFVILLMGSSGAGVHPYWKNRRSNNAHLWNVIKEKQDANREFRDVTANYNAEEIELGLKAHNDYRRKQGASDMLYMVILLTKFWILATPEVVKMTTSDAVSEWLSLTVFLGQRTAGSI